MGQESGLSSVLILDYDLDVLSDADVEFVDLGSASVRLLETRGCCSEWQLVELHNLIDLAVILKLSYHTS